MAGRSRYVAGAMRRTPAPKSSDREAKPGSAKHGEAYEVPDFIGAGDRFEIKEKMDSGSFGDIVSGVDQVRGGAVAIKIEQKKTDFPQLEQEVFAYMCLKRRDGSFPRGVPRIRAYSTSHTLKYMDPPPVA